MVFTAAQITSFFEDADQCGLINRTRVSSLNIEGITSMDDLADWEDDDWDRWAISCKKPDKVMTGGVLVEQQAYQLTVKSLKRLKIASALVRYYESVSIPLTHVNMKWLVLKSFDTQMKVMKARKKEGASDVPKLSKNTTVPRWNDSLKVHMNEEFGARDATLRYLMRENDAVPAAGPLTVLATNHPHTADGKSIEADQMNRLSHVHPLYSDDNAKFYRKLEEAVRGTTYEASIKPYQITGDGRGAYRSLLAQHCGKDKWTLILRHASEYVTQRKWDGTTGYTLQSHVDKCRDCYVEIETAVQYVPYQVPLPSTRVTNLLNSIETCVDPNIAARRAAITIEANNMWNNWEKAVEHLLPADPVANKIGKKRKNAHVSGVTSLKKVGPKTGVELRFYKHKEFRELTDAEKDELRELRPKGKGGEKGKAGKGQPGKGKPGKPTTKDNHWTKKIKGKVATLVKEQLKKQKSEIDAETAELEKLVAVLAPQAVPSDPKISAAVKLQAILKKRKVP